MTYERDGFVLYSRKQPLRRDRVQTVYFFAKREPIVGQAIDLPDGYVVAVHHRTGVPYLKKK